MRERIKGTYDYRGAKHTVALIKRVALASAGDYGVRAFAEKICQGLPSKDFLSEYLAIYYYVLSRTRYMRDPRTVELVREPAAVIKQIQAGQTPSLDCDDMAALICALVLAVGGQCRVVTVAFKNLFYKGQRQYSHVFASAKEPKTGQWIILDPVAGDQKTAEMRSRVKAAKLYDSPRPWPALRASRRSMRRTYLPTGISEATIHPVA